MTTASNAILLASPGNNFFQHRIIQVKFILLLFLFLVMNLDYVILVRKDQYDKRIKDVGMLLKTEAEAMCCT